MANLNKVMLIGRLTRDPEVRTFSNGGKVAKFGFAVNNSKKNPNTGQWEDEPVYIDCDAFNRGETGKLADRVEKSLAKGHQVYLEGHLKLETWTDQTGQKKSKLSLVVDNLQFLEPRQDGMGGGMNGEGAGNRAPRSSAPPPARKPSPGYSSNGGGSYDMEEPDRDSSFGGPGGNGSDDEIPF
jgi:single-strand DNA-binding protein